MEGSFLNALWEYLDISYIQMDGIWESMYFST